MTTKRNFSTRLRILYDRVDHAVDFHAKAAPENKPACKKGCAHCCNFTFPVTLAEALYIVDHLCSTGAGRAFLQNRWQMIESYAYNLAKPDMTNAKWFAEKHPCPMLDTRTNACTVYSHRPGACRVHVSVSGPVDCATGDGTTVKYDSRAWLPAAMPEFDAATNAEGFPNLVGPLPYMLMVAVVARQSGPAALAGLTRLKAMQRWAHLDRVKNATAITKNP